MALSLTEWLQHSRLVVVAVDAARSRVRLKSEDDACRDLACSEPTLVVTDDGATADLAALHPGDIVKLEETSAASQRIVVVRRAWDELTSPEW